MPRMNVLNAVEQEAFESAPVFNSFQRKQYFDFPQAIQQATANLRTPANQLCFLLSCGYFKASKRFFPARTFHPRDVEYVVGRTGLRLEQIELHLYAKETSSRHRGFILDFYGFKPFRPHGRPVLAEEIARLLRSQIKPKVIFWRCVDVLIREKIEVPGYFPLADQILSAIKTQNQTLAATIERTLDTATRAVLDDLLTQEPLAGDTVPGKTSAYKLSLMKKLSQSTKPSKVKERVADLDLVRGLYHQLSPALQAIALKPGGHREATGSDRARAPVHARRIGRQSTGISTGGERGPGDGGSLQAAHQKLHHLLELSLPVAKVGRDRGCRDPAGVSRCCGTRLGDFLAAHQLAGRV